MFVPVILFAAFAIARAAIPIVTDPCACHANFDWWTKLNKQMYELFRLRLPGQKSAPLALLERGNWRREYVLNFEGFCLPVVSA